MSTAAYITILFVAGALLPFQAGMNAEIAKYTSNTHALLLCILIGLPIIAVMLIPQGLPSVTQMKAVPWWAWIGGVIGIFYVFTVTFAAKHTGAFALVSAVTAGQIIGSMLADHYGAVGFQRTPVSLWRIGGAMFVALGVWMSVKSA